MKKLLFCLLTLFLSFGIAGCLPNHNTVEPIDITGGVTENPDSPKEDGDDEDEATAAQEPHWGLLKSNYYYKDSLTYTYEYNDKGLLAYYYEYDMGELIYKSEYVYDEKGKKTGYKQYRNDGSLFHEEYSIYDDKGNYIFEQYTDYYNDGTIERYDEYSYDENRGCHIIETYIDGSLTGKEEIYLDEKGNKIKDLTKDENDVDCYCVDYEYYDNGVMKSSLESGYDEIYNEFDEKGNCTLYEYKSNDGSYSYKMVCEYNYSETDNSYTSVITYYDENGNFDGKEEMVVDNKGYVVKDVYFDANNIIYRSEDASYDPEMGFIMTSNVYGADGSKLSWTEYSEDPDMGTKFITSYYEDGTISEIIRYYINGNNYLIEFYEDTVLINTESYEYDENGNMLSRTEKDSDGNVKYKEEYEYQWIS